jgi:hypothetical protein
MQKGFKKVVKSIIQKKPGFTAREYAEIAVKQGLCGSDSKDPIFSLATTLMKEVREGRMLGIKAVKVEGKLHYFPDNFDATSTTVSKENRALTVLLPPDVDKYVETLVEVGVSGTPSEALIRLAREGIKAKQQDLFGVEKVVKEINALKQSVHI